MTEAKIVTIRTAGGVLAQGELIGVVCAGRATINADGLILTGWHVPHRSDAAAPHPDSGHNWEGREAEPPIVGG